MKYKHSILWSIKSILFGLAILIIINLQLEVENYIETLFYIIMTLFILNGIIGAGIPEVEILDDSLLLYRLLSRKKANIKNIKKIEKNGNIIEIEHKGLGKPYRINLLDIRKEDREKLFEDLTEYYKKQADC